MNDQGAFYKKLDGLEPDLRYILLSMMDDMETKIIIRRSEFDVLKDIVGDLAEAQKKSEARIGRLEIAVVELVETQKKSGARTGRLEIVVMELAEAQKRTELKIEELVEAQTKTEYEVKKLTTTVSGMKKQLGGLAMNVGYGIEDKIIPYIRDFGKKEFGTEISTVDRRNLIYPDGNYDEINIYAEGTKDGHPLFIIGECKAQPGKKDFDRMGQMLNRVKKAVKGDIHPFLVGYHFSPDVEAYAEEMYPHIRICKSFEFELKYKKF